jgi:hypothetical protein
MTPRQVDVLTVVGLLALLAAVSLTAPRWSGLLRSPLAVFEENGGPAGEPAPSPSPAPEDEVARRINVRLYFASPEAPGLLPEERSIPFSSDLAPQVRTLVEELVRGPTSGLLPTLPSETRVLAVFVTGRGVAYVDLSREATAMAGGSREELLTVYSIVNSLVANFPAVGRVQILLEDRIVPSLSGHVDLGRPLPPDMTLVALPPIPATPGEATP